jgi:hypothetical protein
MKAVHYVIKKAMSMKYLFRKHRGFVLSLVFMQVPFFAFPQDGSSPGGEKIPSLEDIARQTGNYIKTMGIYTFMGNGNTVFYK